MVSNISSPFSFVLGPADVVFIDCVAGVGKGRGRELGKAARFLGQAFSGLIFQLTRLPLPVVRLYQFRPLE